MLEKHCMIHGQSIMELYMMNARPHGSQYMGAKDLWEKIKLLMQGTSLTEYRSGSASYPLEQFQVNTKFLNTIPDEWSKFVTDVKLVKDLHTTNQQPEFSQPDFGLVVPMFQKGDDPIDAIDHMMSFLTAVVTSRYPTTNNQLRTSSNPRQQATIYDGKVTVQPVQGRQTTYAAGTTRKYTPGASGSNTGKQRTVISQASGQALTEEEIAFLADPELPNIHTFKPLRQSYDPTMPAYQPMILDAYDSDCENSTRPRLLLWRICPGMAHSSDALTKSHSKMLLKEQDPLFEKHRVNTKPINYAILNNDYYKRFVRQSDLYSEHAYWKATSVPALDPSHSSTTVIVEVPKELPTVSMVNTA
ncbi:hypothetical protein Tco_1291850 [Tanacetum coccineum]